MQLIIENLSPALAARLAERAARSGRSVEEEAMRVLVEGTVGDHPVALPNAPIGSAFKRRIAALGITKEDCAALESSLDAIRESRSDSLHRWVDFGDPDFDEHGLDDPSQPEFGETADRAGDTGDTDDTGTTGRTK